MSQVIITKYINPTNCRPSRIKATCWRKTVTVSWDHALEVIANHKAAAEALIKALESDSDYRWAIVAHGPMPDDTGRAFIIEVEDFPAWLTEMTGTPQKLLRSEAESEQLRQTVARMMVQMQIHEQQPQQ